MYLKRVSNDQPQKLNATKYGVLNIILEIMCLDGHSLVEASKLK